MSVYINLVSLYTCVSAAYVVSALPTVPVTVAEASRPKTAQFTIGGIEKSTPPVFSGTVRLNNSLDNHSIEGAQVGTRVLGWEGGTYATRHCPTSSASRLTIPLKADVLAKAYAAADKSAELAAFSAGSFAQRFAPTDRVLDPDAPAYNPKDYASTVPRAADTDANRPAPASYAPYQPPSNRPLTPSQLYFPFGPNPPRPRMNAISAGRVPVYDPQEYDKTPWALYYDVPNTLQGVIQATDIDKKPLTLLVPHAVREQAVTRVTHATGRFPAELAVSPSYSKLVNRTAPHYEPYPPLPDPDGRGGLVKSKKDWGSTATLISAVGGPTLNTTLPPTPLKLQHPAPVATGAAVPGARTASHLQPVVPDGKMTASRNLDVAARVVGYVEV